MSSGLYVKNGFTIPANEIEISVSRAGGPGGQHVNKTESRVTVRWNVKQTQALNEIQKERVLNNLKNRLTIEGDLIVHNSESRSQQTNKENALAQLAKIIRKALYIPKKRMKTAVSKSAKEARLQEKAKRGTIKKLRSKKIEYD